MLLALFLGSAGAGCANRGMVAPRDGGGSGGGGGTTDAKVDIPGTDMGSGGGGGDGGNTDVPVEKYEATPPPCNTRFNFENGMTYGAKLGPATMMEAFKAVVAGTEHTQCGFGSLQLMTQFSGTTGNTIKGIVVIDLPMTENLAGKTLTIGVATELPATPSPTVSVSFVTATGFVDLPPVIKNIPATFLSTTHPIPATATAVSAIYIVATDSNSYTGKLYIDEIDIK
ncbi:MAG TPA: hypothetical protein VFH73_10255 [Polyangia bacterium]|jgi:hypothetical protein|nr:hypothetical protein [Polyangia bacterium]